jgi:hypothetical protein
VVRGVAVRAGAALATSVLLSGCWVITSREETGSPVPVVSEEPPVTVDADPDPQVFDTPVRDGRHAAYLDAVEDGETIVFDPIAFLTGEAAREIYDAEHPDDPGGPPNDYLIVNQSATRFRAPLAPDAEILVVEMGAAVEQVEATVDQLAQRVAELPGPTPFWVVVRDGDVVAVEEQYVP